MEEDIVVGLDSEGGFIGVQAVEPEMEVTASEPVAEVGETTASDGVAEEVV